MHEQIVTALMLVVAVIHFLPITGFVSTQRLASLYGMQITDRNMEILMRHRAVLFGMLGTFLAYAAFTPAFQPIAFVAAGISLVSFFFLSFSVGEFSPSIRKIVIADVVASVCLIASVVLYQLG